MGGVEVNFKSSIIDVFRDYIHTLYALHWRTNLGYTLEGRIIGQWWVEMAMIKITASAGNRTSAI
jgi:hypothetical protein